jgi:hypothetical protein
LDNWYFKGKYQKGAQFEYSDACIELCLTIKLVFKLGYRQTQGFLESIFEMWGVDLSVPSYSDICKRSSKIVIKYNYKRKDGEKGINISADSTGLKVYGEGEWKVRKHGWSKHRTWQKLHMAINPEDKIIISSELTGNNIDDADVVNELLKGVKEKIGSFIGDGAYDKNKVYELLKSKAIKPIIPPRKNAKIRKHKNNKGARLARDKNIRGIRKYGRKNWKQRIKYHQRSISETNMFRYKTIIGEKLKSRIIEKQKAETKIACKIINTMTRCGMPISIKINYAA